MTLTITLEQGQELQQSDMAMIQLYWNMVHTLSQNISLPLTTGKYTPGPLTGRIQIFCAIDYEPIVNTVITKTKVLKQDEKESLLQKAVTEAQEKQQHIYDRARRLNQEHERMEHEDSGCDRIEFSANAHFF